MIKDFREFLLRGNLVELAIAVVIGLAFAAVIKALTADLITPLIAAAGGNPNFAALTFTINGSVFRYGDFLNALITFAITAAVVFFFVVRPVNKLIKRYQDEPDEDEKKCLECLSKIPADANRCAFCTAKLA